MKTYRTNITNNKPELTRRDFLGRAGKGAGLAGLLIYAPNLAYAGGKKVYDGAQPQNIQDPQSQNQLYVIPAYLIINPAEFPIQEKLYGGQSQQYANPRLASKNDLSRATPSYREIERKNYKSGKDVEYDMLADHATKELFDELIKYCAANGIDFVGDREAYFSLVYAKPEWAGTPEAQRNENLSKFLALYDITSVLSETLLNRKYEKPESMGSQLSGSEINNFLR